ncbi:hypothetical protein Tco_1570053 [Tanacetum coccineum]
MMSSPNHPTSNIEEAFSSNFPDYIPASLDYSPASPGNTYSSSSNKSFGLIPIASRTFSLFHDDSYMKVMQAYYAKESPILPPTIVPPSPMLYLSKWGCYNLGFACPQANRLFYLDNSNIGGI